MFESVVTQTWKPGCAVWQNRKTKTLHLQAEGSKETHSYVDATEAKTVLTSQGGVCAVTPGNANSATLADP